MNTRRMAQAILGIVLVLGSLACKLSDGALSSALETSEAPPSPETTSRDVPYILGADQWQTLDVYPPASGSASPAAVMLYVHGGGWTIGDKRRVDMKDDFFTQQGWVFVSVNYRLAPRATWREMAGDIAAAIAWVHEHIAAYGGNAERIFLMGHSAGAHLVSLVATDESYLEQVGLDLSVIKGVLALDTRAYDIPSLAQFDGQLPRAYAPVFGEDSQEWKAASPLYHLEADKHIPPFVIAWSKGVVGGWDREQRETIAKAFAAALEGIGVQVLLIDGSDKTHGEINQQFGLPDDPVTLQAMEFLSAL